MESELSFEMYTRPCTHRNDWRNVEQACIQLNGSFGQASDGLAPDVNSTLNDH